MSVLPINQLLQNCSYSLSLSHNTAIIIPNVSKYTQQQLKLYAVHLYIL